MTLTELEISYNRVMRMSFQEFEAFIDKITTLNDYDAGYEHGYQSGKEESKDDYSLGYSDGVSDWKVDTDG